MRKIILFYSLYFFIFLFFLFIPLSLLMAADISSDVSLSKHSQRCLGCHTTYTPGIVEDWLHSDHSRETPEEILKKPELERTISSDTIPDDLRSVVVGCFECHGRNPSLHKDNFQHFGFKINVIVSPNDCKICHSVEVEQFWESKKAYALDNLQKNSLFHTLVESITGLKELKGEKAVFIKSNMIKEQIKVNVISSQATEFTKWETCYACHGTRIIVEGMKKTSANGADVYVPNLNNWPNQGVGRINPDESRGACTTCHPRHSFSIETARKPYTCSQCHVKPDIPAYNVFMESKHGNIVSSKMYEWDWHAIPWTVGKDFRAPTCAVCHVSLIVTPENKVILPRTHNFGERLWVRMFGLIYAHPQPKEGKTFLIKNKDGLPLPTTFSGELATEFLIDESEQVRRQAEIKKVCQSCHGILWSDGHFAKFENTINETNKMTRTATELMVKIWNKGAADQSNPFDEAIEQRWIKQWLFFSNSVRFASAMCGPDYATFKNGWWELTNNLSEMKNFIKATEKMP